MDGIAIQSRSIFTTVDVVAQVFHFALSSSDLERSEYEPGGNQRDYHARSYRTFVLVAPDRQRHDYSSDAHRD
jgi:hypothetical protein